MRWFLVGTWVSTHRFQSGKCGHWSYVRRQCTTSFLWLLLTMCVRSGIRLNGSFSSIRNLWQLRLWAKASRTWIQVMKAPAAWAQLYILLWNAVIPTLGDTFLYAISNSFCLLIVLFNCCLLQIWQNLTIKGILPESNMLMGVLVDDMAKAAELKSNDELKVCS